MEGLDKIEWQLNNLEFYFEEEAKKATRMYELKEASRKIYFASKILECNLRKITGGIKWEYLISTRRLIL